jgi:hypothetical protein
MGAKTPAKGSIKRGRRPEPAAHQPALVAADLETAILIATRLRDRNAPILTEQDVARWVDAFIDLLLAQRRREREHQLHLARQLRDPTIESLSEDVGWLKTIEDLRASGQLAPPTARRALLWAEGRLLGRLLDPARSRLLERRILQAARPRGGRPRGVEPEVLARCAVGVVWDVSAPTVQRIVHRHRSGWRSAFETYAVADALSVIEQDWERDISLAQLLEVLTTRESARRAALRRRQRRSSQVWRWVSSWPIPASIPVLREIVSRMGLPMTSDDAIQMHTLSKRARQALQAGARLADYLRDDHAREI